MVPNYTKGMWIRQSPNDNRTMSFSSCYLMNVQDISLGTTKPFISASNNDIEEFPKHNARSRFRLDSERSNEMSHQF